MYIEKSVVELLEDPRERLSLGYHFTDAANVFQIVNYIAGKSMIKSKKYQIRRRGSKHIIVSPLRRVLLIGHLT